METKLNWEKGIFRVGILLGFFIGLMVYIFHIPKPPLSCHAAIYYYPTLDRIELFLKYFLITIITSKILIWSIKGFTKKG